MLNARMSEGAPGYPGLGPIFGWIGGVWYLQENEERVTIVLERVAYGHWWLIYRLVENDWVTLGRFFSNGRLTPGSISLFAEIVDVAHPVDPRHRMKLVVEDGPLTRWWVIHGTAGYVGPLVAFSAPKRAFVVPI